MSLYTTVNAFNKKYIFYGKVALKLNLTPVGLNGQGESEKNGRHVDQGGGVEAEGEVRLVGPPGHVGVPQGVDTKLFFVGRHFFNSLFLMIHVTQKKHKLDSNVKR
jgi:hypothetical protein